MNRYLVVVLLFLLQIGVVVADHSPEPVVIRTVDYDSVTRRYTFSCFPGPGLDQVRHWAIRPDTQVAVYEVQSSSPYLNYTLDEDVIYHISCGALNGTQFVQSDYHIDRRLSPDPTKPHVTVLSSDATSFVARCEPPANVTNYALQWWTNNYVDHINRGDLAGQNTINTSVPYPALWELVCGVWDNDRNHWSQISYTVEFFSYGPAYTPSVLGCIPNDPCYTNVTLPPVVPPNGSNGSNSTPPVVPPTNSTNSTNATGNLTCYNSAFTIPVSCTGGSVISDALSGGCRVITCQSGSGSVTAKACNKNGFFEMYRQSGSGSGVSACLGSTCISNNGYAKSPNFPICIGVAGNGTNTTLPPVVPPNGSNGSNSTPPVVPPTNSTNSTSNSTCYNSAFTIPVSCTGGSVISDALSGGCRVITCSQNTNSLTVKACNKPGNSNAQFFEMYRQSGSGSGVRICLGTTCLDTGGYAKSQNFPLCVAGSSTNSSNSTPSDTASPVITNGQPSGVLPSGTTTATLSVMTNEPAMCRFDLQDPQNWNDMIDFLTTGGTTHSQPLTGLADGDAKTYYVRCRDTAGNINSVSYSVSFSVANAPSNSSSAVDLAIAPWFPQGLNYVFHCNADGFTPTSYDWVFGDGQTQNGRTTKDVYHSFTPGNYVVQCTARDGVTSVSDTLNIVVG